MKTCKGLLKQSTHTETKTADDIKVLQSKETIGKKPILNMFEILPQTSFLERNKDDEDDKITHYKRVSF